MRRGLQRTVVGHRIRHVEVGRERVVRRTSREELVARLTGVVLESVRRRGKYLFAELDSGDRLMIHLRMSGQVLVADPRTERPAHTHVVLALDDSCEVRFVDPRTFGEVVAYDPADEAALVPEVARLGPDPVAEGLTRAQLGSALHSTSRPVKAALLDQRIVAGIGNIYGDEILHRAGISPVRPARAVNSRQLSRLHEAVHAVLGAAVEAGGSTLGDAQYVDVSGAAGGFQDHHRVYARSGLPCLTCGRGHVVSAVVGGRTTSWCRVCQR